MSSGLKYQFGSPFVNDGAGRIKTDAVNQGNIQTIIDNYYDTIKTDYQGKYQRFTKEGKRSQYNTLLATYLGVGATVGILGAVSFVRPHSRYIGKFFTLFTTYLGWKYQQIEMRYYDHTRRVGNFTIFPKDIKNALENNDFRYAYRWLGEQLQTRRAEYRTSLQNI